MIQTNKHHLPDPLVNAMSRYPRRAQNMDRPRFSVTSLINAPRPNILATRHDDKIVTDAMDGVWMITGSAVHNILEAAHEADPSMAFVEQKLVIPIKLKDGRTADIVGIPDRVVIYKGTLQEWKFPSVFSVIFPNSKIEWTKQLNIYAWMLSKAPEPVLIEKLEVWAILRDWMRSKATQGRDYPPQPIHHMNIPLAPLERTQAYVLAQAEAHAEALGLDDDQLPECSPEERWAKPDSWAVKKAGAARAVPGGAGLKSREAAQGKVTELSTKNPKNAYDIEYRRGESTKCGLCPASSIGVCSQFEAMKAGREGS